MRVYRRLLLLNLLLPLIFATASAREAEILPSPRTSDFQAKSGATPGAGNFHLKGVLVSQSGGLALINGRMSRVGDRVAGAEIVAITEGAVRISTGSRELDVYVGSSFAPGQSLHTSSAKSGQEAQQQSARTVSRPIVERSGMADQHSVAPGETLSGISKRYAVNGVTLNQMMIALFRANPNAFGGNINVLRQGASLQIPSRTELSYDAPKTATAEVMRQTDEWRTHHQRPTRLAQSEDPADYGPIRSGETLSVIAERVLPEGATINQMMIALYETNRAAFGDNINLLYAGSVLQMPGDAVALQQRPEIATAEVTRQTDEWRSAGRRPARSIHSFANMTASSLDSQRSESQPHP